MQEKMISVIVPVYNLEKELPRCLDSILAQSYSSLEVIVIDDGSQDGSNEIICQYARADRRVKLISQENGGVTSARLRGVLEASGEWIGFVDGDDEIQTDMYGRLLENAIKYNAKISHCGYQMIFPDGRVNYFYNTGVIEVQDTQTALCELLSGKRIEPGLCNKLFHHSLFQQLAMSGDIRINEDLLMNYQLFSKANSIVFDDWCPYYYIVRSSSASRSKLNLHRIYDPIRVKQAILDMPISKMHPIELSAQKAYISTCINVFNTLMVERANIFEQEEKDVRQIIWQHRHWIGMLSRKQQLLAKLILYFPGGYRYLYRFYAKYFQKNPYA
ncbi:MAG: glycosyltransferase [Dysosmobacter sp.]|jgi:glycosyltransferase involved in cell wall biosynthesis|uniref:glycosyltransferase n=1 Tax=Dysosmobacter sp. TaxID=2591382 RepID=UPI003D8B3C11